MFGKVQRSFVCIPEKNQMFAKFIYVISCYTVNALTRILQNVKDLNHPDDKVTTASQILRNLLKSRRTNPEKFGKIASQG